MKTIVETDSSGRKHYSVYDGQSSSPVHTWIERPDGSIEYEYKNGHGVSITDLELHTDNYEQNSGQFLTDRDIIIV
jgi:hypothetical protein